MLLCRYRQEFGFVIPGRKILVDDVRIRGIGRTRVHMEQTISPATDEPVCDMVGDLSFSVLLLLLSLELQTVGMIEIEIMVKFCYLGE